jgi:hypothetical protein
MNSYARLHAQACMEARALSLGQQENGAHQHTCPEGRACASCGSAFARRAQWAFFGGFKPIFYQVFAIFLG